MQHSFYGEMYSEGYDKGEGRYDMQSFYLERWNRLGKPIPVLEPMCGTGFFLAAFLDAGADIDGLDASPYMLRKCQDKVKGGKAAVNLYQQRLEDLSLPRKYNFIYIPDRSFAQFDDRETAQVGLGKLWDCLLPGGWFVLDVRPPPPEGEFGKPGETSFGVQDRPDGSVVFRTTLWSKKDEGRVIRSVNKFEVFQNGSHMTTELFDYHERFYERDEFGEMLRSAGFTDIQVTKAYEDAEPAEYDCMVFSCRKPV